MLTTRTTVTVKDDKYQGGLAYSETTDTAVVDTMSHWSVGALVAMSVDPVTHKSSEIT